MIPPERVVLAADHAGFPLKEIVKNHLMQQGIDVIDTGTFSDEDIDYPEVMRKGCAVVLEQHCPGFVFGGSGNGEAMAANKVAGIRCALCWNEESTRLARAHNNANIMSIGARLLDEELVLRMVDLFLSTPFDGGRHQTRIDDLEPDVAA